ncbi:DUF2808 domain-containing protein [Nostoc sp. FACHB-152]|uniref:DUF2808 domain-containing protein n=1 Tax=unclassified Nostoc TaxID=2593658 RepID=UPI001687F409|nr:MULTISPECIES: DUF2808 domain-containing protein [unclassified Nostoc]MBD2447461.1 DUF2808 domain-containing protein [Nostoc sp. FACHB-152]MBD2468271.1 DUF2808 domain-containing protein [Nostoc sp. FACHB-145]
MKYVSSFLSTLLIGAGICSLPQLAANAVTLGSGTIAFEQPPRLVSASTPYNDASASNTTYYFTVEVPATTKESLQQVTFTQVSGIEKIEFNQNNTAAFLGTRDRRGEKLAVKSLSSNDNQNFTVNFAQPIQPGQTVTIALRTYRNPSNSGVYLFGVKAFPSGEQTVGQFLGVGRLQFYQDTYNES